MEPKTYGLDTLAFICAGSTNATDEAGWAEAIHKALLPRHEVDLDCADYKVRDGGLWRNGKVRVVVGTPTAERDVLRWQPVAGLTKPALPIPFTAAEFAAFTLAGRGIMVIERFEDDDDEDALSEAELAKLGRDGTDAREVLREAHRLRLEAKRRFSRNCAKPDEPPRLLFDDADTDEAARWLLDAAHLGAVPAAAGVVHPGTAGGDETELLRCVPPAELLLAFKPWLKADWFKKLDGWLLGARRREGTSGRGGRPALFCPHAVMVGLTTKTRGMRLPKARGWHILREHFCNTYAAFETRRPRTGTAIDE